MAGTVEAKAEWARMAEEETAVEETVTEAQLGERMAAREWPVATVAGLAQRQQASRSRYESPQ